MLLRIYCGGVPNVDFPMRHKDRGARGGEDHVYPGKKLFGLSSCPIVNTSARGFCTFPVALTWEARIDLVSALSYLDRCLVTCPPFWTQILVTMPQIFISSHLTTTSFTISKAYFPSSNLAHEPIEKRI